MKSKGLWSVHTNGSVSTATGHTQVLGDGNATFFKMGCKMVDIISFRPKNQSRQLKYKPRTDSIIGSSGSGTNDTYRVNISMRHSQMDGFSFDRKFVQSRNKNRQFHRLSMPHVDTKMLDREYEETPSIHTIKPNRTNKKLTPISFLSSDQASSIGAK